MNHHQKIFYLLFFFLLAISCKSEHVVSQSAKEGVTAFPANDFLNSLGVCSSITGRGETLTGTMDALHYTGIRFSRAKYLLLGH